MSKFFKVQISKSKIEKNYDQSSNLLKRRKRKETSKGPRLGGQ
jgi:hypothetical protein